jgi:hypothetical protein
VGSRPQLVIISGLSVGNPFKVGSWPQLVVLSGLSLRYLLEVGYRLLRSLRLSWSLFTKLLFLFFNLHYHGVFHKFFLHTAELRLLRSLFTFFFLGMELRQSLSLFTNFSFSKWNLGYHKAFSRTFLSRDGI